MRLPEIHSIEPFSAMALSEKPTKPGGSFSQWLMEKVQQSNDKLQAADESLQALAQGQGEPLHQTLLTLEEAKMSFQLLEQIRNRFMLAYQDILREQI